MTRCGEERLCRRDLDDLAEIHDDDARAQQPHHVEIVRDEQIAHRPAARAGRRATAGSRPAPTRRARRSARRGSAATARPRWRARCRRARAGRPTVDADSAGAVLPADRPARRRAHALVSISAPLLMPSSRFSGSAIDLKDAERRIEAFGRVLEHDLDAPPARRRRELRLRHRGEILAAEQDLARRGIDQPAKQAHHGGFAAAGFADEADALSGCRWSGPHRRPRAAWRHAPARLIG